MLLFTHLRLAIILVGAMVHGPDVVAVPTLVADVTTSAGSNNRLSKSHSKTPQHNVVFNTTAVDMLQHVLNKKKEEDLAIVAHQRAKGKSSS